MPRVCRPPRPTSRLAALGVAVGLAGAVGTTTHAARAEVTHVQVALRHDGDPTCVSERELRAAVTTRLGYDPFVTDESSAHDGVIDVRVRRVGAHLEGTLSRSGRGIQRAPSVISSKRADCNELTASLAVAVAIAIDPLSLTRDPAPATPPTASAAPASPPPAPPSTPAPTALTGEWPPPDAKPAPPSDTKTQLTVGAGPSFAAGALPSASFGARALVGIARGLFELDVEGRFDPPVSLSTAGGSVEASLALATVSPCVHHRIVIACAQASFGALRGTGRDFDHTREANTFYAAAGARGGIEIPLAARFALRMMLEGSVPLRPTRLEVDGAPAWSTPSFAFAASPMLVGRLP